MASKGPLSAKRTMTGNHRLLPASRPGSAFEPIPRVPTYSFITWTLGRGSVIWRIWPAVLLHTLFAAAIVTISMRGIARLEIPTVMLTVLGVVIGFVISYRAISGYDRYWMGRTCWSDIIRNSRTLGRLVWFHVPPRLTPKTPEEIKSGEVTRSSKELLKVMAEKRLALDLILGFAVSLKHHIRGELGIYYEDLYHLVRPLHDHDHKDDSQSHAASTSAEPRRPQRISAQPPMPQPSSALTSPLPKASPFSFDSEADPIIPAINEYGTFDKQNLRIEEPTSLLNRIRRSTSSSSLRSSNSSQHQPLLPSTQPREDALMDKVSGDLIPFSGLWSIFSRVMTSNGGAPRPLEVLPPNLITEHPDSMAARKWKGPIHPRRTAKHPTVLGEGENLPLEVLRCLSEWFSVLEDRGTVPGTSLGAMIGAVAAFEDNLTALERILTTPLPFVYSVHIRTVWIYLFFLPFQLVSQFGYYTIPGVAIAAFIYLGFLAAGEEIEQPFGYDDNDLDLDLFCQEVIHADIDHLKKSPCLNAYLGAARPLPVHRHSMTVVEVSSLDGLETHEGEGLFTI